MRTAALVALALWLPASIGIGLLVGRVLGRALRIASLPPPRGDTFDQSEILDAGEVEAPEWIGAEMLRLEIRGRALLAADRERTR